MTTASTGAADEAWVVGADLGGSSARVVLALVGERRLRMEEVSRTPNVPARLGARLHWDLPRLHCGVLEGLREAGRRAGSLDSVGIDSWAVDYGLVDADGELIGLPVHYRDERTADTPERVYAMVSADELYFLNGLQRLSFTTMFQLVAEAGSARLSAATSLLLIPDLLTFWLTGRRGAELTNASTTGLVEVHSRTWATELMSRLGIDADLLPPLRRPGDHLGDLLPGVMRDLGLAGRVPVTAVGSHDTASAVVAVPALSDCFAYVCTGTWSLVGLELAAPVVTAESRAANFTNEAGVDDRTRFLRNVMGLWLLQECLRTWGEGQTLSDLLAAAGALSPCRSVVDVDSVAFLPPGDMPSRIADVCRGTSEPVPQSPAATVRCVLDSLALGHRRALDDARRLAGVDVDVVHLVGGGVRNDLLCQLTADACGLPVVAGPVEAAAVGNVLVQARALGVLRGELSDLRLLVAQTSTLRRYEPATERRIWEQAMMRVDGTS